MPDSTHTFTDAQKKILDSLAHLERKPVKRAPKPAGPAKVTAAERYVRKRNSNR